MLIAALAMLSAATSAAEHVKLARVFLVVPPKYPKAGLSPNSNNSTRAKITISPDGKVVRCDIVRESGDAYLDHYACDYFRRARATPAKSRTGQKSFGTIAQEFSALGGNDPNRPPIADVTLAVSHMPTKDKSSEYHFVAVSVDEAGNATDCDTLSDVSDQLDTTLCKFAMKQLTFKPALDVSGKPVPSIQSFVALFTGPDVPAVIKERR
ncbi:TonB family protein [Sphingomonas populi]|uniref:TonB family protein n=1 Tax=Sphingomonas populi TaxID=2484750 RepID=A0A4Q6Y3C3_9SPHN|nr:TonB family protein [Sphingomonas populi]RZF64294.1 TonB family protein [Sphingomonas populi]